MLTPSNIDFRIDRSKKEGIANLETDLFPSHFLGLICGKRIL